MDRILQTTYPDAHCELDFQNPYELLVATILSAQCTDQRVNQVTPALFARCLAKGILPPAVRGDAPARPSGAPRRGRPAPGRPAPVRPRG